jgi:DNA polymerase-3 subunit gamma/tau
MDVVEIDAASETGVDNVREKIIENVQYVPTEARYKVYIIDEVHDLSAKAFDALLKTLEEPPPHVVFVLATTEHHKVPITIRSRCIPFQFKRGTLSDLSSAISRVVEAEGYSAEPTAIRAIARCAEGSWRDALSLLEQVIAYSDSTLTEETVQQALGTVGSETLGQVVDTLARDNWSDTLAIAGALIDSGKDVRQLITSLSGYLRDLLLIASGAVNTAQMELGADRTDQLTPQAKLFSPQQLLTMLGILAAAEKETRVNNQDRWLLERSLCSLMPANLAAAERSQATTQPMHSASTRHAGQAVQKERGASSERRSGSLAGGVGRPVRDETVQGRPTPDESDAPNESRFVGEVSLTVVRRAWPRIIKAIEKVSPSASGYLQKAEVVNLEQKVIVLTFSDAFARDRILNKGKALVEKKINEVLQSEGFRIRLRLDDEDGSGVGAALPDRPQGPGNTEGGSGSPAPMMNTLDLSDASNESRAPHPPPIPTTSPKAPEISLLEETLEIFGGEVIRSEPGSRHVNP